MSKIRNKTCDLCMVCEEKIDENKIILHKTRRQLHCMCHNCFFAYISPIVEQTIKNFRKNIKTLNFLCTGTYKGEQRNKCKHNCKFSDIKLPKKCNFETDFFLINFINQNKNAYICQNNNCKNTVIIDETYLFLKIECQHCCTTWCKNCLKSPYHESKTCFEAELEDTKDDNMKHIIELHNKGTLKLCPRCRTPIIKESGCNKMHCESCKCVWCWLCSEIDIDYPHFNSSKTNSCAGKLWNN